MGTEEIINSIENILIKHSVPINQIKNIAELIKIYGEIQFSKGSINELKKQLDNAKK